MSRLCGTVTVPVRRPTPEERKTIPPRLRWLIRWGAEYTFECTGLLCSACQGKGNIDAHRNFFIFMTRRGAQRKAEEIDRQLREYYERTFPC